MSDAGSKIGRSAELERLRLEFALKGAAAGLRVIPLVSGKKQPIIKAVFDKATTDAEVIANWTKEYPGCNFSFVMGEQFCVLDIDVKRKGHNGFESLKGLCPEWPDTFQVRTPSGGMHFYYRMGGSNLASVSGTKRGWFKGIDLLARKKLCLVPYSVLEGGGSYEPKGSLEDAKPIPRWLIDAFIESKRVDYSECPRLASSVPFEREYDGSSSYPQIALLLERIDPDIEYEYWFKTIFAVFNELGRTDEATGLLLQWSSSGKKWDEKEFSKKIESYDPSYPKKIGIPFLRSIAAANFETQPLTEIPVDQILPGEVTRFAERHLEETIAALRQFGNEPDEHQKGSLRSISHAMMQGLFSTKGSFRRVYPLETGMGKTTSVAMLCKVIAAEKLAKSLAIFVETVLQGHELRTWLNGIVPQEETALLHNAPEYKDKIPSIAVADAPNFRFLIACHNRAKTATQYNRVQHLLNYQARTRDLVIWDESLNTTKGHALALGHIVTAAALWKGLLALHRHLGRIAEENKNVYEEFDEFLDDALAKTMSMHDGVIALKALRRSDLGVYRQAIRDMLQRAWLPAAIQEQLVDCLVDLIEFSIRGSMRLMRAGHDLALLQFQEVLDEAFARMIILDASAPIRDLLQYDTSVEIVPLRPSKDYSAVTIRHANIGSSKYSFNKDPNHLDNYAAELIRLLEDTIPDEDEVLVICYKEKLDELKDSIAELGHERTGTIHYATWGKHRATNLYGNCKWLYCVGVPYLDEADIAAMIVGQRRTLDAAITPSEITAIQHSEQADALYQAISRGNSRKTIAGKAGEQTVYLFHPTKDSTRVLELLQSLMPSLKVEAYAPSCLKRREHKASVRYRELGDQMIAVVNATSDNRISVKKIRASLPGTVESNSPTHRKARDYAFEDLSEEWTRVRQSLVRKLKET